MTSVDVEAVEGERTLTCWLHVLAAAAVAVGLLLQLGLVFIGPTDVNPAAHRPVVPLGSRLLQFFSYFTIQSNILVLIAAVLLARRPARDGTVWRILRLTALLGIMTTGIVFGTLLAPLISLQGVAFAASALLHYVSPALFLGAWIVLGPRPRIAWTTVAGAFIWPVAWIGYTLIHGAVSGWYPYPFLDVAQLGYPTAVRNIMIILLAAAVIGVLFRFLDRLPALNR